MKKGELLTEIVLPFLLLFCCFLHIKMIHALNRPSRERLIVSFVSGSFWEPIHSREGSLMSRFFVRIERHFETT